MLREAAMKTVLITLVAVSSAFAQHAGPAGFGRASSGARPLRNGGPTRFVTPPPVAHPVHGATVIVPYPVFYGGYYYDPTLGAAQQPAPGYGYNDPNSYAYGYSDNGAPSQSPVVIMNQSFRPDAVNPVFRDYTNVPLPEAAPNPGGPRDDQPTIYLIAMTDHTIFATVAYWVEGDSLTYITVDGNQNKASLALVDREFSAKLNADRNVEFRLPAAK
jgi:hypothetical protein